MGGQTIVNVHKKSRIWQVEILHQENQITQIFMKNKGAHLYQALFPEKNGGGVLFTLLWPEIKGGDTQLV